MRNRASTAIAVAAALTAPASGLALEKHAVRFADERGEWSPAGGTCSVSYYNLCTGYIWVWSGWDAGAQLGTVYDPCGPPPTTSRRRSSTYAPGRRRATVSRAPWPSTTSTSTPP